jgi:PilZ domain
MCVAANCITELFLPEPPPSVNHCRCLSRQPPRRCIKKATGPADLPRRRALGRTVSETRASKRHKWRLPCEIVYEGGRQRSFVIDLSATGLFIQTGARLKPGAEVEVRLTLETAKRPLVLRASVARAKQVPSQLTSVAHGGVGLRLVSPPQEYLDALRALDGGANLRSAATPTPVEKPKPATLRFRVRVKQQDGPRMRILDLEAVSIEDARKLALHTTGAGWEVVAADRLAS